MASTNFALWILPISILAIITPTSAEYYRNPGSDQSILCTTETCTFHCDINNGCYRMTVLADEQVTTLHFICSEVQSCYKISVQGNTITHFNLECTAKKACDYFMAHVNEAQNINVHCDYNATANDDGACYRLDIYGRYSGNTNFYCNGYRSCYASFLHLNDASSATIIADGQSPFYSYAMVFANNMTNSLHLICVDDKSCSYYRLYADIMPGDLSILCGSAYSCQHLYVYTESMSGDLTVSCEGDKSCTDIDLFVDTMEGDININCHAETESIYPCDSMHIDTDGISGSLTVDCKGKYGCYNAQIYCPQDCNVVCDEVNGCDGVQVYLDDHLDPVNFICSDTNTSCSTVSINCDSGASSSLLFDLNTKTWNCNGYGCCPWERGEIVCAADAACLLTLTGGYECRGYIIDATKATSLVMNCIDAYSCEGMKVFCPEAIGSSCVFNCIGAESCDHSLIRAVGDEMNEFTLNCQSQACTHISVLLNVSSVSTVNVLCNGVYSCESMNLFIPEIANDVFTLDCGAEGACQYANFVFGFNAPNTNIDINCINPMGSTTDSMAACRGADISIIGYISAISLYCSAYDCWGLHVYADNTQLVNAYCTGEYSCYNAHVDCPSDDIGVCNIECKGGNEACYSLNIAVDGDYVYDFLNLNCEALTCEALTVDCTSGSRVDIGYIYNATSNNYECESSGNQFCCPYYEGKKVECEADKECIINCNNEECNNALIDGQQASFLEVHCGNGTEAVAFSCKNTHFICPNTGCNIICRGDNTCDSSSRIAYRGNTIDEGSVSLFCEGSSSCRELSVEASFANVINLNCSGEVLSQGGIPCDRIQVYGEYANTVHLYFSREYPSYSSYFYLTNAKEVVIDFHSVGRNISWSHEDYFYVENASSVTVNCVSGTGSVCGGWGWDWHHWYIPPDSTTFNCYGNGCSGLFLFAISQDVSGININLHSCGKCGSARECIDYIVLFCGETYSYSEWFGFDHLVNECQMNSYASQGCQCDSLISNLNFYLTEGAQNCYEPMTPFKCDDEDCTVNCDSSQNCQNWIIDGRNARTLSVNCKQDYVCEYSLIYCPDGGCHIICDGFSSCGYVKISYNGTADNSATVSLKCTGADYACNNVELDAREAAYVVIDTDVYRGFYNGTIHANNVNTFTLNATNEEDTFSGNEVYIEHSKYAVISCHSTSLTGGCDSNTIYLPNHPIFRCYGFGCYNLGEIYFADTSNDAEWQINGCGLCDSSTECILDLNVHCNNYIQQWYYDYYWYTFDYDWHGYDEWFHMHTELCHTQTEADVCGCYDMFNERMIFTNEEQCTLPKLTQYPTINPSNHPSDFPSDLPSQTPAQEAEAHDYSTVHPVDDDGNHYGNDDGNDDLKQQSFAIDTNILIGAFVGVFVGVLFCTCIALAVWVFRAFMKKRKEAKLANNINNMVRNVNDESKQQHSEVDMKDNTLPPDDDVHKQGVGDEGIAQNESKQQHSEVEMKDLPPGTGEDQNEESEYSDDSSGLYVKDLDDENHNDNDNEMEQRTRGELVDTSIFFLKAN